MLIFTMHSVFGNTISVNQELIRVRVSCNFSNRADGMFVETFAVQYGLQNVLTVLYRQS